MHTLPHSTLFLLSSFVLLASSFNVSLAGESPFTPKAYLIRYYKKQISNVKPKPWFLLNKASPLSAVDAAAFTKLAAENALSGHLSAFCSSAHLLCFPDLGASLEKHDHDVNFASYLDKNFTNYGTSAAGGLDSFKNYSDGVNLPVDDFRRYSRNSAGHGDKFNNYAPDSNVADQSFHTYGTGTAGGSGEFKNYNNEINIPGLHFTTYSDEGTGRTQTFTTYADEANAGDETFTSYGKNGNGASNSFNSYGNESNVVGSNFNNYGENGNAISDNFTSYGFDTNVPENNFKIYGHSGNGAVETFTSYRDQSNVGDDSFISYAKNSNVGKVNFVNYGQSFNEGTDKFTSYGTDGATAQSIGFNIYGVNNTFADYAKKGVTFANYINGSSAELAAFKATKKAAANRWVEPGKFFREAMLMEGTVMSMPDIRDKMPKRSFLPRVIVSKLPFSSSKLFQVKEIFHARDNSSMEGILASAISECERKPSPGETKQCVGSVEDMIDFATSMLGRNIEARTTENTQGSKQNILIGSIKQINGGKITKSVSCHQSLYPYLLYFCHSVPQVRVYEADILDSKSKVKINHGVAICHIDTSSWSPTHAAFLALGSVPGKIEVCHWIFENDLTWTIAD